MYINRISLELTNVFSVNCNIYFINVNTFLIAFFGVYDMKLFSLLFFHIFQVEKTPF